MVDSDHLPSIPAAASANVLSSACSLTPTWSNQLIDDSTQQSHLAHCDLWQNKQNYDHLNQASSNQLWNKLAIELCARDGAGRRGIEWVDYIIFLLWLEPKYP